MGIVAGAPEGAWGHAWCPSPSAAQSAPGEASVLSQQAQLHGAPASALTLQPPVVPILPREPHPLVTAKHCLQDLFPKQEVF